MGFGSGCYIMQDIITGAQKYFPDDPKVRRRVYHIAIRALDAHDWDTHGECLGRDPEFDAALAAIHPGYRD